MAFAPTLEMRRATPRSFFSAPLSSAHPFLKFIFKRRFPVRPSITQESGIDPNRKRSSPRKPIKQNRTKNVPPWSPINALLFLFEPPASNTRTSSNSGFSSSTWCPAAVVERSLLIHLLVSVDGFALELGCLCHLCLRFAETIVQRR